MKTELKNVSSHVVDLSSGRLLGVGESAAVEVTLHEQTLLDAGHLVPVEKAAPRKRATANNEKEAKDGRTRN